MTVSVNGVSKLDNIEAERLLVDNIAIGATPYDGIKVGVDDPTYGWRDLIGLIKPDVDKFNAPTLKVFRAGKIREYSYSINDMIDCVYHIPHDYAKGTPLYIHAHWGHNGTDIDGTNGITFTYSYADRTDLPATTFPVEQSQILSITASLSDHPQYCHSVNEIQLSDDGGTGSYLNTNDIEIDGVILINVEQTTLPSITDGDNPFIFTVDIHYQSTGVGTKSSSADFYT